LSIVITANALGTDPFGGEMIRTVVSDMTVYTAEALHLVRTSSELLTVGPVDPPDPQQDRLRLASFTFLQRVATAVHDWVRPLEARLLRLPKESWPADAQPQIEALQRVAHELGIATYFASGVFRPKSGKGGATTRENK
jgi:hypothetical protein